MALTRVGFYDLRYDHRNKSPVLFLKDNDRDKYLPVWIGELEASSIEWAVIRKVVPRPMTHDLFANVLHMLGVHVLKVIIDRLDNGTYYATLHLDWDGGTLEIDSRPSDAIAIALRENAQIFVEEELMYKVKFVELTEAEAAELESANELGDLSDDEEEGEEPHSGFTIDDDSFRDFLGHISPSDFKEN